MAEHIPSIQPHAIGLTKEVAEKYATELALLADQIPLVDYTPEDILAEQKGDRQLHNKWEHSLFIVEDDAPIALIIGYEREAEGNEQYPRDTLYISELAVSESYQQHGIGHSILRSFLEMNNRVGFKTLPSDINYSVQTNSAEWNASVVKMYESFGFTKRTTKEYPNRIDVVLGASLDQIQL